jgi:sialate O-acetylesterase
MALRFSDGSSVGLGGQWRYQFVPESMGYPSNAPWQSVGGLTSLYNAMISPLVPYGLKGALWYQGESNTAEADHYQGLLKALMSDWRREFAVALPFLVVELPNFGALPTAPAESAWANLREAQRRAVSGDSRAALAVTIDLGVARELHPPNKQAVGQRLARAARHLVYGEGVSASGPIPRSATHENDRVAVRFDDVAGGLVASSSERPIGFELCGPQSGCRFVDAVLQPGRVLLDATNAAAATRVRFCWGDAPVCNLYDQSGLPAGPFEITIQPIPAANH